MSSKSQHLLRAIGVVACVMAAPLMFKFAVAADDDEPTVASMSDDEPGAASTLFISVSDIDFGEVTPGEAETAIVVFTNTGVSESIVIQNLFLDERDSKLFTLSTNAPITLEPAQSVDLVVGFEPENVGVVSGSLIVSHTGSSAVDVIDLYGEGKYAPVLSAANPLSLPFGKSSLAGFKGGKPTSIQFGPDGKLYVAFMDGDIHVMDVERLGDNDYEVIATDHITLIKNITNHNDDGKIENGLNKRLVTGLLVKGTSSKPVIYVLSSDPRIGGGHSGNTTGLDTNSGILSRLTKTSDGWQKLDLVRGFPRSEENHHGNGMALVDNTLYIASGGNTNMGATSNNFAMLPEYALSAAILSVDLEEIGENTYDLPTLDDENRSGPDDSNDPFGGNRGKNQARLVQDGPVQVYAPGFRNPYDVIVMNNGKMYSWDNGPNSGWGGAPGNCSNARKEPGNTQHDALHLINGPGYYGGHPNPTRGSQKNTFNKKNPQSPVPYGNSIECNYYGPGTNGNGKHPENKSLVSLPRSTNGLTEYAASNLSGAITSDLLAVSWDNKVYRVSFKPNGELEDINVLFSNVGVSPLDITAQPDNAIFPGTIWVADLQAQKVVVYEPDDYDSGSSGACVLSVGSSDADADGFSNADELANGTDGCSAADIPADVDGDFVSDLIDPDDDNDNIADVDDPFAIDPDNGASTGLPVDYQWENDSPDPGFLASLGFTGLMTNGVDSYQTQYDLNEMTIIGAAGVVTVDSVPSGDPLKKKNTQQYGFQFGVDVGPSSPVFRVQTRVLAPFSGFTAKHHQSMGLFIGTGDQDNYVKLTTKFDVAQMLSEVDAEIYYDQTASGAFPGADYVNLTLEVDPASAIVTAFYQLSKNGLVEQEVQVGSVDFPATWLSAPTKLAVGIISTSVGAEPFPATWDFLTVKPLVDSVVVNDAPSVAISSIGDVTTGVKTPLSAFVIDNGLPASSVSYQWSMLSGPEDVSFDDNTSLVTAATFSEVGDYELQLSVTVGESTVTDTVSIDVGDGEPTGGNIVYRINAGGSGISADDGDWQSDSASSEYYNTGFTWESNASIDIGDVNTGAPAKLFSTERFDRSGGPELEWKLPVTPGEYVVRLYFAEIYFGAMSVGARVFNVAVEDQIETGVDVFASVGANKGMVKTFTVQADDTLNILLTRITQNPAIKGIEVLLADNGGGAGGGSVIPVVNQPPLVIAGANVDATVAEAITLSALVADDGLPANTLSAGWSVASGPATPLFSEIDNATTQVTFPEAGTYMLNITATDGELSANDELQVVVTEAVMPLNKAPTVTAGADITTTVTTVVSLTGAASDDGLPSNIATMLAWTMQSGPATVTFGSADTATTTASFSQAGQYVLRLSATDTVLASYDEVIVTVLDIPAEATVVYRINAGGPSISDPDGYWSADNGSSSFANTGIKYSTPASIDTSGTPGIPAAVFQSERFDREGGADMNWKLPVTPGSYDVHVYFAEIYSGAMGDGKRVFDVTVEGQTLLALDVYAEAGDGNAALVKSFAVSNTDGVIDITFKHIKENPAIKGIEVVERN